MTDAPSPRRWLLLALKLFVVVAVCLGVSRTLRGALAQLSQQSWQLQPLWLVVSGLLYLAGLAAMGCFWHAVLGALGQRVPWLATFRAYFLGHLGKYVPGKALVVILRVAGVRPWVPSLRIAVVSSLLETLTMMAVGAFLAAMLAVLVLQLPIGVTLLAAAMAIAAGLPTMPPIARRLARIGMARLDQTESEPAVRSLPSTFVADSRDEIEARLNAISLPLVVRGWFAACACWTLLGLSLWAVLRAIGVEQLQLPYDLPLLVAAVSLAVVAGFLSLLPGGILVRDALLMQMVAPICGDANALVAAVLLRLVWLVTELGICGILYIGSKKHVRPPGRNEDTLT